MSRVQIAPIMMHPFESKETNSRQNNPLSIAGIVHEMPNAMDHAIAARLLPRLYGRVAGFNMMLLNIEWFPKGLFPGVEGTGQEEILQVA